LQTCLQPFLTLKIRLRVMRAVDQLDTAEQGCQHQGRQQQQKAATKHVEGPAKDL